MKWFAVFITLAFASLAIADNPSIQVVNEDGQPIKSFEAATAFKNQLSHERGTDGKLSFYEQGSDAAYLHDPGALFLSVVAEGYAPTTRRFLGNEKLEIRDGTATITLTRGREVRLRLKLPAGMQRPASLVPQVFFPEFASHARTFWGEEHAPYRPHGLIVRTLDDGEFAFRLPIAPRPFYIGIDHPGWLRFYEAGPYTIDDFVDGVLEIALPRPGALEATFDLSGFATSDIPFEDVRFDFNWYISGEGGSSRTFLSQTLPIANARLWAADLAPRRYRVAMMSFSRNGERPGQADGVDPAQFADRANIDLQPGQTADVRFAFVPFDAEAYRGDRTARLTIFSQNGTPAGGKQLKVTIYDGHYGYLNVHVGSIPEDGVIRLEGLSSRLARDDSTLGRYVVSVDDQLLGYFHFRSEAQVEDFEFRLVPGPGDAAPEATVFDLQSKKELRLSELRGKVVFVEFWATWCGPCQEPMEKLNALLKERGSHWGDRVAVVPISIDDTADVVGLHAHRCGWTHIAQYFSGGEESGYQSSAAKAFVINRLPQAILVDCDGRIVWRGHPATIDLGARISELLPESSGPD